MRARHVWVTQHVDGLHCAGGADENACHGEVSRKRRVTTGSHGLREVRQYMIAKMTAPSGDGSHNSPTGPTGPELLKATANQTAEASTNSPEVSSSRLDRARDATRRIGAALGRRVRRMPANPLVNRSSLPPSAARTIG